MKILETGLKKEDIALSKRFMHWKKVLDDEIRLFINLDKEDEDGNLANTIDYKNNIAYLCISSSDYNEKFYSKYKDLKVRLFVREDRKSLYSELSVKDWYVNEKGIVLNLN